MRCSTSTYGCDGRVCTYFRPCSVQYMELHFTIRKYI
uniref:Uncharacterized protein n=1 Tax=Anguilla anguilla TaxID=7936 RepID=A0A0E9S3C7_ANGAN